VNLSRFDPGSRTAAEDDGVDRHTDETTEPERPESVTPEQLCDYLGRAGFRSTLGRSGYSQREVDAFLTRLAEAVRAGEPLADLVRKVRFTPVRLQDGYDTAQVDEFLAAAVDLDPHAIAPRPEVGRSGLIAKLFG
jgi:DivIVA domain-containing protein